MRKYIILILCLVLVLSGCTESGGEPPKGMSKEFYEGMLVLDKLIQKSFDAKFDYVKDKYADNKENKMIIKALDKEKNEELTELEKAAFGALKDTLASLDFHIKEPEDEYHINSFNENYTRFKKLLEP